MTYQSQHFQEGTSTEDFVTPVAGKDESRENRKHALHLRLQQLGIDADALADAAFRSVATTDGFDQRFGKSAIKAYRTYIDPRPSKMGVISRECVDVGANRIARQIDFLAKRHRSREADWVRHTGKFFGRNRFVLFRENSPIREHHIFHAHSLTIATSALDEPKDRKTFPLILVLDNVRSAANVGSIYRSADACGCLEILTTGITPHPHGNGAEKLSKSALGAERVVPTLHFDTTQQALEYLRRNRPNFMLVAMETTERSKCYTDIKYPGATFVSVHSGDTNSNSEYCVVSTGGVALFLGNEVSGVDTEIMPLLDEVVEIPMFGKKNSLNVASCAPVVMYEVLRQWGAFA
ncbi:hypothetical protein HJC23_008821 [Cyclotella cryptica]|uniref:tRNA/rRNA methyltransferase SpoU type domain-containing protein n=1 Tax=Cyclotella cryptica TaxID=29204 RepID=A0ABD3Q928_9STRA